MSPSPPSTHPLEFLVGTWVGKGRGFYPTIREFHFLDEITFTKDPACQPVVAYSEKAFRAIPAADSNGQPTPGPALHAENGYIRLPDWSGSTYELILCLPAGVACVELGTIKGSVVQWASAQIIRSPGAPVGDLLSRFFLFDCLFVRARHELLICFFLYSAPCLLALPSHLISPSSHGMQNQKR